MMETASETCRERKEKAQGMVEFALTLPLLLVLIFGIIEFGRLLFYFSAVVTSSRQAARYGSAAGDATPGVAYYQDCDGIYAAAKGLGTFAGVQESNTIISYDNGPGTSSFGSCPVGGVGPQLSRGDRIRISISVNFDPFIPIIDLPNIPIVSDTRRTIVKDVPIN